MPEDLGRRILIEVNGVLVERHAAEIECNEFEVIIRLSYTGMSEIPKPIVLIHQCEHGAQGRVRQNLITVAPGRWSFRQLVLRGFRQDVKRYDITVFHRDVSEPRIISVYAKPLKLRQEQEE